MGGHKAIGDDANPGPVIPFFQHPLPTPFCLLEDNKADLRVGVPSLLKVR
jgi:hypothetical protein